MMQSFHMYIYIYCMQLFPQLEEPMLLPLKSSLEHYERMKLVEDMKVKEKVKGKPICLLLDNHF